MPRTRPFARCFLIALLGAPLLAQEPAVQPAAAPPPAAVATANPAQPIDTPAESPLSPASLLDRSHALASLLAADDRAYLLGALVAAASQFRLPAAKTWAEEVFSLTPELTAGSAAREYAQATGVLWMSRADSGRALEMLEAMDPPSPAPTQLGATLRSNALRTVFQQQLAEKGASVIPDLRQHARRMGDAGQYPYSALLPLVTRSAADPELVRALFAEALDYYRRSSPNASNENDYLTFLRSMWRRVPQPQAHEAGEELARHLAIVSDAAQNEKLQYNSSNAATAQNGIPLERVASQQLSLLRQIDPKLADAVVESHPALNQNSGAPSNAYSITPPGDIAASTATAPQANPRVQRMARTNADNAIKAASAIQDPRSQAAALAEIVPTLGNSDPQRTQALLGQVQQAVNKIDDDSARLAAITSLARAASTVNDQATLRDAIQQGFASMQAVMRRQNEDHPENRHTSARTGYGFGELVRYGMGVVPEFTLTQVDGIADDETRAFLLIRAAQGLRPERQPPQRRLAGPAPAGGFGAARGRAAAEGSGEGAPNRRPGSTEAPPSSPPNPK